MNTQGKKNPKLDEATQNALNKALTRVASLEAERTLLLNEVNQLKKAVFSLEVQQKDLEKQVSDSEKVVADLEAEISKLDEAKKKAIKDKDKAVSEFEAQQNAAEHAQAEKEALEASVLTFREHEQTAKLSYIDAQKKADDLKGRIQSAELVLENLKHTL